MGRPCQNLLPAGTMVHLAFGYADTRKGMDGLAVLVQEVLHQDPFTGHLFVFRGRRANLIKIVFWNGTGLCLFTKRLEHGVFVWPANVEPGGTLSLTSEQLSHLLEGIDWLGHTKMDSTVRYLGIELEDALEIAESIEI